MTIYKIIGRDPVPPGAAFPATVVLGSGKENKKKKMWVVDMSKTNVVLKDVRWWLYILRLNGLDLGVKIRNIKDFRKQIDKIGNSVMAVRKFTKIIAPSFGPSMGLNSKGIIWNVVAYVGNLVEVVGFTDDGRYAIILTHKLNKVPRFGCLGTMDHLVTYMDGTVLREQGKEQVDNVIVPLITKSGLAFIPRKYISHVV
jgi:hypothetical protein